MPSRIGRFEIRSELGRGAQSVVYLGFDPRLQREVALKTLSFGPRNGQRTSGQAADSARLMAEARTVGRLQHPNIVTIFEAGEADGDPYLVFEYVAGRSLDQLLQTEGRLPPAKAARMMIGVLDALQQAHDQGVVHRDLKPSNILIDAAGTLRVTDFGISVRIGDERRRKAQRWLSGTPSYMAPETVAGQGASPVSDLYAAGLVLLEMLTGRRTVSGGTPEQILDRVQNEPLVLPPDMPQDERLGAVILTACAHDPRARYASAKEMKQAISDYLDVDAIAATGTGDETKKQSTLDFLLRRMRHKTDFPALSDSVAAINRMTASNKESMNQLSNAILKDFGLTNKILRLVNSAYYRQAVGGSISTVSRAAVVLGFDAIRNIAVTVLLFEHLENKGNSEQLKEAFLRANFSGLLARNMSAKTMPRESEEAFICAMFHGLGRLLAQYYFPEEMEEILKVMQQKRCGDEAAAAQVLGIGFEDLGIGIARSWGFPRTIVASMRRIPDGPLRKPTTLDESLHLMAGFANELCDSIAGGPAEERQKATRRIGERYLRSLPLSDQELQDTLESSFVELTHVAAILRVNLRQSPFVREFNAWSADGTTMASTEDRADDADLADTILGETRLTSGADEPAEPGERAAQAEAILTAGIQDISNSLVEERSLNDILRITLETMYRAMGFTRVILCLRDIKSNQMVARFGFGPDTGELVPHFRFLLSFAPDVFQASMAKGFDLIINDVDEPKIQARIPAWYRQHVPARTFVLFPLLIKGRPVALIYCDKNRAGSIVITDKELSLLKTLRNQALLALKQAG